MYHYSADKINQIQNYKFLTGSVVPRPIAWLMTKNQETDVVNLAPFSFFTVVSSRPPLVLISVNRMGPEQKDTASNLLQNGQGVIHIVSDDLLIDMNQTAASLPPKMSELELIQRPLVDSHSVAVPALADALIRLEVTVEEYIPVKDEAEQITSDLFLLKVADYYFNETIFDPDQEYILTERLDPISRLAGNNYSHLKDILELRRPY